MGLAHGSTDIRLTLHRICSEISILTKSQEEIPEDYKSLKDLFVSQIRSYSGQKTLLIVLDAINQLEDNYGASSLEWLPEALPGNVRLVVSTLKGKWLEALQKRYSLIFT